MSHAFFKKNSSLLNSDLNCKSSGNHLDHQIWPKSNPLQLYSGSDKEIQGIRIPWIRLGIRSDRRSAWWTMDGGLWHCTGGRDQDHPRENKTQKCKMAVWGGLTNSWEKKRNERQKRKVKIYPLECRVPNSNER